MQVSRSTHEIVKSTAESRGMKLWFVVGAMARAWARLSPEQQDVAIRLEATSAPSCGDADQSDSRDRQKQRRKANAA